MLHKPDMPDSLGADFTWEPRTGLTDAQRNCVSNVRDAGLAPEHAARTLYTLLWRSRALVPSGVAIKDESEHDGWVGLQGAPGTEWGFRRHGPLAQ